MPNFTPLQLRLRIRNPRDLDVNLISKEPVFVSPPPHIPLHDRIPCPHVSTFASTSTTMSSSTPRPQEAGPGPGPEAQPLSLPPIDSLPSSPIKTLIRVLDLLFEPSTALHTLVLPRLQSRFKSTDPLFSYTSLIDLVQAELAALLDNVAAKLKLHAILSSHPRLGAPKAGLGMQSAGEQAQLQGDAELLRQLNGEYEAKFPGLRYVVFVNGRQRDEIRQDMRRRIDRGDVVEEEREAVDAMVGIARDRMGKLGSV